MAPVLRQHGRPFEGKGRGREDEEGGRIGWFTLPDNKAERWRTCRVKAPRIVPVWWPEWWTGTLSPAASWTDGCGSLWDSPGVSEPVLTTDLFTLFNDRQLLFILPGLARCCSREKPSPVCFLMLDYIRTEINSSRRCFTDGTICSGLVRT